MSRDFKARSGQLRVNTIRAIVLARAKAGETSPLAKWIDTFDNPADRAVFLAVAQQLLGLEGKGLARLFR